MAESAKEKAEKAAVKEQPKSVSLSAYSVDRTIRRRVREEEEFSKTKELSVPQFTLAIPRLQRGDHAYLLFPDDANDLDDKALEQRTKQPLVAAMDSLNRWEKAGGKLLEIWPSNYKRGEG